MHSYSNRSSGNPAGCIYLDGPDTITADQMQQIAREMAGCVSEVVFIYPEDDITTLRFFSSECEVAFCGHGTIAAMYDLIRNDVDLLRNPILRIRISNRQILVRNEIAGADSVFISAPSPVMLKTDLNPDAVAAALRIPPGEIANPKADLLHQCRSCHAHCSPALPLPPCSPSVPISRTSKNSAFATILRSSSSIPQKSHQQVQLIAPGCLHRSSVILRTRPRDPGMRHSGIICSLTKKWDGKLLTIEQGRSRDHPNIIRLVSDASEKQRTVFFGGNAVVRIEGEYLLQ